jgi:hypothetical protein
VLVALPAAVVLAEGEQPLMLRIRHGAHSLAALAPKRRRLTTR